jgi:hypothetical protein
MPITLNHSNIGVQYNTGSNYIIETVKSDLYRRNEIVDTIVSNNLQAAPVTPVVYIENSSGNVYAIESYTYTGTANTADYTRVFPKSTTCDILIVGGGGGGGSRHAGGGGAGAVIYSTNITLTAGTYTIGVGKGGTGKVGGAQLTTMGQGNKGEDSSISFNSTNIYLAKGGGAGNHASSSGNSNKDGGSGGGGGWDPGFAVSTNIPSGTYGNSGGINAGDGAPEVYAGGGGGGAGSTGNNATIVSGIGRSGNGGNGIQISITGTNVYYGGGGGGGTYTNANNIAGTGGLGGGGAGSKGADAAISGTAGTGGGGGGGGYSSTTNGSGGAGGSGIVIIRYLLGTIPTNNLLKSEPTVTPYVLITDAYYPRVPATNSATWIDNGYTVNAKVSDPIYGEYFLYLLFNHKITSKDSYHSQQTYTGTGNTYVGSTRFKTFAGIAISVDFGRSIYPKRMIIAPRPLQSGYTGNAFIVGAPKAFKIFASNDASCWNDNNHSSWTQIHDQTTSLSYVNEQYTIVNFTTNLPEYRYYTMVVLSTIGNYAGGYMIFSEWNIGGDENIVAIPEGNPITHKRLNFTYSDNLVAWYKFNGDYLDSSGNGHNLTNVGTVIQSTHIIEGQAVEFDSTDYLEFPSSINPYTIWNGNGITFSFWVRITSITGTYSRFIDFQSAASTNAGIVFVFNGGATRTFYLRCNNSIFEYNNNSITTNLGVWHHILWCIDKTGKWDVYLNNLRINGTETATVPNITYNLRYINKSVYTGNGVWGGQMDDFRIYDRALSAADVSSLYNKTYSPNTYTLNFPVPTIADINNNSNIVLRGEYDISLSESNASIIPKSGQYIPKPTTFTNYNIERMYPPVRNFTAATTTVSGQTYGNGTYVVSFSSTYGQGYDPWTCFNIGLITGGSWAVNNYTSGNYNGSAFIVAGYLGEWLIIQLPVAIKLTSFEFVSRPTLQVRSPKDFKIYGSNDNITWVELVNKTDAVYNASSIYEQTTPEITNTYTYYGLVVNKIFTGANDNMLNFNEWYIYGQEVLSLSGSLSIRYNLLNPILDPIGAQWTYNSSNTNVYHMGSVGIGTKSPEYQLDVRGFIHTSVGGYTQTGSENWIIQSDRRIKENIVKASYEKCLENVKNIELYNFNFKDNCVNTNDRHQLGFIAQEVQQVYPKAVEVGKIILDNNQGINDLLTLNTTQIKYTLYGAVKNLIERVENIESRVEQIYNMTLSSNFKSPSSNISISIINTSNMTANTSNIATNTSNIAVSTSNIATNTSNIAVSTSNIAVSTSNIATNTSNITTNTSNIAVSTSNVAVSTSNIAVSTSNINTSNIDTSNIDTSNMDTSNIDTSNIDTSNIDTSNIDTSNIDTSNIDTSNMDTSNINTSNIDTSNINTSNIDTSNINTSNINTSNIDTSNINTSNIDTSNMDTSNIDTSNIDTSNINTSNV